MYADVHSTAPRVALGDVTADEIEPQATWRETAITVVAATVTILFVSFVAVVMALA